MAALSCPLIFTDPTFGKICLVWYSIVSVFFGSLPLLAYILIEHENLKLQRIQIILEARREQALKLVLFGAKTVQPLSVITPDAQISQPWILTQKGGLW